ncbi:MAG: protein kinase [Pseudomonadota bacterium]
MSESIEIDGYTLIRKLGAGGMASVYLAREEKLDRMVAIKIMNADLEVLGEDLAARFQREAQVTASSGHPNIVAVYNYGFVEGRPYIAMDYLSGGTLRQRLTRDGAMAPEQALELGAQLASALELLHSRNIVHRDLKPDNVLFHQVGHAVLADFGIAKLFEANTQLTSAGMTLGTYGYLSPEQATGDTVDGRSDIYSLGVVMYEALTGELPIPSKSTAAFLYALVHEGVQKLPPGFEPLQDLFDRALARQPSDRFQQVAEFGQSINDMLRALRRGQIVLEPSEAPAPEDPGTVMLPAASLQPPPPAPAAPAPSLQTGPSLQTEPTFQAEPAQPGAPALRTEPSLQPAPAAPSLQPTEAPLSTDTTPVAAPPATDDAIVADVRDSRRNTGAGRRPSLQERAPVPGAESSRSGAGGGSPLRWALPAGIAVLAVAGGAFWLTRDSGSDSAVPIAQTGNPEAAESRVEPVPGQALEAPEEATGPQYAKPEAAPAPVIADTATQPAPAPQEGAEVPGLEATSAIDNRGAQLVRDLQSVLAQPETAETLRQALTLVQGARADSVTHFNLPSLEQQMIVRLNRFLRRAVESRQVAELSGLIAQVETNERFRPLEQDTQARIDELVDYLQTTASIQFERGFFNIPEDASLASTLSDLLSIDPDNAQALDLQVQARARLLEAAEMAYANDLRDVAVDQLRGALAFAGSEQRRTELQEKLAAWEDLGNTSAPDVDPAPGPAPQVLEASSDANDAADARAANAAETADVSEPGSIADTPSESEVGSAVPVEALLEAQPLPEPDQLASPPVPADGL